MLAFDNECIESDENRLCIDTGLTNFPEGEPVLELDHAEQFVRQVYTNVLKREPNRPELEYWASRTSSSMTPAEGVVAFYASPEGKKNVRSAYPNGHFYSLVVEPHSVRAYFDKQQKPSCKVFDD